MVSILLKHSFCYSALFFTAFSTALDEYSIEVHSVIAGYLGCFQFLTTSKQRSEDFLIHFFIEYNLLWDTRQELLSYRVFHMTWHASCFLKWLYHVNAYSRVGGRGRLGITNSVGKSPSCWNPLWLGRGPIPPTSANACHPKDTTSSDTCFHSRLWASASQKSCES